VIILSELYNKILIVVRTGIIVSLIFFTISILLSFASTHTLTIHITNIKEVTGVIQIGIYNNADDFPKVDKQYLMFREEVRSRILVKKVKHLPAGEYAIAIYHDLDNDSICNKNFFGYPKEPFGFSNDVRPVLSAPSFKVAKFSIPEKDEIYIKLNH
jgi:uncharacterized protein (DUF2141 family)